MSVISRAVSLVAICAVSASLFSQSANANDGRKRNFLGGLAVGAVGGVLLDRAINGGQGGAAPVAAEPVYDAEPTYAVRPVRVVEDPYIPRMSRLKMACDDGDTNACIRFGIIIGQHKEREAQWRRLHPDMFAWDVR